MVIKFNNGALIEILDSLKKFNNVSGKLGYAISKFKLQVTKELQPFNEQKEKLFEKYGTEDSEHQGRLIIEKDGKNYEVFIKQLNELLGIEVEIDIFQIEEKDFESNESVFEIKDIVVEDFDLLQALFIKKEQDKKE